MAWADEDPCPVGCGHPFHGLPCEMTFVRTRHGLLTNTGRPCGCPGPWADERTS